MYLPEGTTSEISEPLREGKTGLSSPKSLNICYVPMPAIVTNFIMLGRDVKLVFFLQPKLDCSKLNVWSKVWS